MFSGVRIARIRTETASALPAVETTTATLGPVTWEPRGDSTIDVLSSGGRTSVADPSSESQMGVCGARSTGSQMRLGM